MMMQDTKYEFLKGLQEMGSPRIVADADHQNKGFNYENGVHKPDSFVVDLENFSTAADNHPTNLSAPTTNSRITLQRSLSRKVPQRGTERKINDNDALALSSSPRAVQAVSAPEKVVPSPTRAMGTQDSSLHNQIPQHQITIKTGGINTAPEGRWGRRSSFKRSSLRWFGDPKRVLLFFATLSSMGTMLLIYFTLSISKRYEKEGILDWQ